MPRRSVGVHLLGLYILYLLRETSITKGILSQTLTATSFITAWVWVLAALPVHPVASAERAHVGTAWLSWAGAGSFKACEEQFPGTLQSDGC